MAGKKMDLPVTGMTCANCAATFERTLKQKVQGVKDAVVNFGTERVTIDFNPAKAAGAMALSNVTVVINSLLLSRKNCS